MQAVILAGGKGTRLYPVTKNLFPKSLIPLVDTTLLDYLITHVQANGCTEIIICLGHQGDLIKSYVSKKKYNISIKFSQEVKPMGTAGALHLIADQLREEFIVLYGDVFTTINIRHMYQFHNNKKADITIAIHTSDHPYDSTVVVAKHNAIIQKFIEKPGNKWKKFGNFTTTPLYIMRKNVLDFIPWDREKDLAKDIFPLLLYKKKRLFGYLTEDFAKDLGTPDRYKKVLQILRT